MIPEHRRIEPDLALLLGVEGVPLIGPGATIEIPITVVVLFCWDFLLLMKITSLGQNWRGIQCGASVALTPISSYLTRNGKAKVPGQRRLTRVCTPIFTSRRNRPSYRLAKSIWSEWGTPVIRHVERKPPREFKQGKRTIGEEEEEKKIPEPNASSQPWAPTVVFSRGVCCLTLCCKATLYSPPFPPSFPLLPFFISSFLDLHPPVHSLFPLPTRPSAPFLSLPPFLFICLHLIPSISQTNHFPSRFEPH